jgi:5-methyltetrahydropteroyltriglutamate--homocysteine methyltransferase
MPLSVDRILTTHTGSLPRGGDLVAMMEKKETGGAFDQAALTKRVDSAVDEIVAKQIAAGLDLISDGEQSKPDYSTYIKHRLAGFSGEMEQLPQSRDARDFPEYFAATRVSQKNFSVRPCCTGPIAWKDFDAVKTDIARFTASLRRAGKSPNETFMTAVSPGQAARFLGNRYYKSHEEYLRALAAVLKDEYTAIAKAGFTLQVDCPDLASGWNNQFAEATLPQFRHVVKLHLEVLDEATRDVPPEQLRLHLCWGNYAGPHNHDIPMKDIIDLVFASRATAISFEGANPRHEHEWRVFLDVDIPRGKSIIPGVIDSVSNFVEHPRAVADRIIRFAKVAGRENVIAGVDCGFATFASSGAVHPTIVWAKLAALAEGAKIASAELWER